MSARKAAINALRARVGLSQKDFAAVLGVHPMTVSKWERGVLQPSAHQASILRALAAAAEKGLHGGARGRRRRVDPQRFLAAALAEAGTGPLVDLGTLSASNRFPGRVAEIARGDVMSKVVVEVASDVRIGAVITTDSVDRLGLEVGVRAIAIIKATEVIVGRG